METKETMLAIEALKRDLVRYATALDLGERERIKARMIDTLAEMGHQADHDNAVEVAVGITGPVIR